MGRPARIRCRRTDRSEPSPQRPNRRARPDERLPGLSGLVVEDHADTAHSTAELLALSGYSVRVAGCGADALREARAEPPDVVLRDVRLPDLDGWAVTERPRAQAHGRRSVVVAVTGHGTAADRQRSSDSGVDLHLVKPVDPARLLEFLARVSANRRAHGTSAPREDHL